MCIARGKTQRGSEPHPPPRSEAAQLKGGLHLAYTNFPGWHWKAATAAFSLPQRRKHRAWSICWLLKYFNRHLYAPKPNWLKGTMHIISIHILLSWNIIVLYLLTTDRDSSKSTRKPSSKGTKTSATSVTTIIWGWAKLLFTLKKWRTLL